MGSRQRAPPALGKILDFDEALTEKFRKLSQHIFPLKVIKNHSKKLEISCHGIPWFCGVILAIVISSSSTLHQHQANLFLGLILDLILVGVIKAYVRRRRPAINRGDMFATFSVDNFSFPSGHASRAVFLAYFFTFLCPLNSFFVFPIVVWVVSVCLSRILLNRHYLLDVFGGIVLGYFEGLLLGYLWLREGTACYLISFLSDTTLDTLDS